MMPRRFYISRSIIETPDKGRISVSGKIKPGYSILLTGATCYDQNAENKRLKSKFFHWLTFLLINKLH
jgi:hypothetical protein